MNKLLNHLAITGGTHGNELTGAQLIKHWQSAFDEVKRPSFTTELYLTNPKACDAIRRYIDQDLNRQFHIDDLNNEALNGYEQQCAKRLNKAMGPKENPRIDFIIDLHTTTSNMGMTLIFNACDPLLVGLVFYIKQKMPDATIFYDPAPRLEDSCLTSLGRLNGLLIEVGPIAQGLLKYQVFTDMREATRHALDYLHLVNEGQQPEVPTEMSGFEYTKKMPLPKDAKGNITAMVHPQLQDRDYAVINPGDPLFITMNGETIAYEGESPVYGAFINEAAYYDQKVGLSFMKKINIVLDNHDCRIEG